MTFRLAISFSLLLLTGSQCSADLILTLSEAGAGKTRFSFSGSSTVAANGNFGSSEQFEVPGLYSSNPGNIEDNTLSSNTSLVTNLSGGSEAFGSVRLFTQNGTDQIRLGLASQLSTKKDDVLVASGQFVADFDFSQFSAGSFVVETADTGTWRFNVSAVPEPTSVVVFAVAAPVALRRRRLTDLRGKFA